jgi:hypothetical protein
MSNVAPWSKPSRCTRTSRRKVMSMPPKKSSVEYRLASARVSPASSKPSTALMENISTKDM